jgi:hypothetical protein
MDHTGLAYVRWSEASKVIGVAQAAQSGRGAGARRPNAAHSSTELRQDQAIVTVSS